MLDSYNPKLNFLTTLHADPQIPSFIEICQVVSLMKCGDKWADKWIGTPSTLLCHLLCL